MWSKVTLVAASELVGRVGRLLAGAAMRAESGPLHIASGPKRPRRSSGSTPPTSVSISIWLHLFARVIFIIGLILVLL